MITRDDLKGLREKLQADRLALLEDIAERERREAEDPAAFFDSLSATTLTKAMPEVIYKRHDNALIRDDTSAAAANGEPIDEAALLAALGDCLGELRGELGAEIATLRERVATLEGQLSTMMALLSNGNGAKAFGSSRKRAAALPPPD